MYDDDAGEKQLTCNNVHTYQFKHGKVFLKHTFYTNMIKII